MKPDSALEKFLERKISEYLATLPNAKKDRDEYYDTPLGIAEDVLEDFINFLRKGD